jgi:chromate transport protein ChrA
MKCFADKSLVAVFVLGTALLIMVVGGGVMNFNDKQVDDRFYEILNLLVLGLVALLKTGNTQAEPMEVTNPPGEKLEVKDTP